MTKESKKWFLGIQTLHVRQYSRDYIRIYISLLRFRQDIRLYYRNNKSSYLLTKHNQPPKVLE